MTEKAFGYTYPNYDPLKLSEEVCAFKRWELKGVRLYTGVHTPKENEYWSSFWNSKLAVYGTRQNVEVFTRPLQYIKKDVIDSDGKSQQVVTPKEKGIDVRISLDIVRMARLNQLDVVVLFSQDQDFAEVAKDVLEISRSEDRWIKIVSVFPDGNGRRGIQYTDQIPFDKVLYDRCIDPRDYRPKVKSETDPLEAQQTL